MRAGIRQRRGQKIISGTFTALGGERMADDPRSEMELFAGFFHQDFDLHEEDVYEVARRHFIGISDKRRAALKRELADLLEFRRSNKALMNAWRRLGAGYWPAGLDIRMALGDFMEML